MKRKRSGLAKFFLACARKALKGGVRSKGEVALVRFFLDAAGKSV